jgi:hypothetical protein
MAEPERWLVGSLKAMDYESAVAPCGPLLLRAQQFRLEVPIHYLSILRLQFHGWTESMIGAFSFILAQNESRIK